MIDWNLYEKKDLIAILNNLHFFDQNVSYVIMMLLHKFQINFKLIIKACIIILYPKSIESYS
jgi:hypothetical protein